MRDRRHRGFSLIEIIVVIAIIAVLAALAFPVYARAKKAAKQATSISSMHQIGLAFTLYRSDHGELPMRYFDSLADNGYIKDPSLLKSGCDNLPRGYGYNMALCLDKRDPPTVESSYETALTDEKFYKELKQVDEDAAIVADRTCGLRAPQATNCTMLPFYHWGTILRLHEDASVRVGRFWFDEVPGGSEKAWRRMRLFTEKELPALHP